MPMFFYASSYSIYSTMTTDIFTTAIFFSSFIYSQQSFQYPPVSEFSRYFITAELADDFHLLSTVVHWQGRAMPLPSKVLYHRRQPPRVRKSVTNLFIVSITIEFLLSENPQKVIKICKTHWHADHDVV